VPPALVAGAQLDLALIDLAAGELGDAEDALDAIDPAWIEPWRLHTARAALLHAGGEHERALAEARAARASAPEEVLPVVQEAFLLEDHLGDPAGAALAWARARELAGEREDLAAALEIVRARVRIERLERAAGERAARASPTP
jgi:tetratricopeptide (TPR) repeat protein